MYIAGMGLLCFSAACSSSSWRAEIQSSDPAERIRAVRRAGEERDRTSVPLLIDRLDDEDEAVRFYSVLALERITGTRMGYDYSAPPRVRLAAIQRWRASLHEGTMSSSAASRPADDVAGKTGAVAVERSEP